MRLWSLTDVKCRLFWPIGRSTIVARFQALVVESPTQVAILLRIRLPPDCGKLHRDHFLIGFNSRNSPLFTEWVIGESEGLRRQLARALMMLAERHRTQGQAASAIPYAQPLVALDLRIAHNGPINYSGISEI